jgi:hypothetical protein
VRWHGQRRQGTAPSGTDAFLKVEPGLDGRAAGPNQSDAAPGQFAQVPAQFLVRRRARGHEESVLGHAQRHHAVQARLAHPKGLERLWQYGKPHRVHLGDARHAGQRMLKVIGREQHAPNQLGRLAAQVVRVFRLDPIQGRGIDIAHLFERLAQADDGLMALQFPNGQQLRQGLHRQRLRRGAGRKTRKRDF